MSVVPYLSVDYKKEYALKTNNKIAAVLDPMDFNHFQEGEEQNISWKWIHLPMKTQGKELNKLVLQNNTNDSIYVTVLIRYTLAKANEAPLVYYSPTREALIVHDGCGYRLIGGISDQGNIEKYSTMQINMEDWAIGSPLKYQPLTKESKGWGMELKFLIKKKSTAYLYEWEFQSQKLQELEDLHLQYQELLCKREKDL
ncbi:hypothetical protein J2S74_001783 [Evansella vedderi]|uniref:Uncharacterized protein n=1 Tax=Evansella vedderi TaxID=38282 RepID=A0ABT9ZVC2_9BACI|nr:hypothetical protein [Evansella vedderi]MDQ0254408.1 hypothetical protein [Evansella vedderi]